MNAPLSADADGGDRGLSIRELLVRMPEARVACPAGHRDYRGATPPFAVGGDAMDTTGAGLDDDIGVNA